MLRCSFTHDLLRPVGGRTSLSQYGLFLLVAFLLVIPWGCSTVKNVGKEFGVWGVESLIQERFTALCAEVNLRPAVDVELVIEDDLEGLWGYAEKKRDRYVVVLSLKKLQWQPEMIETILRHEMAHVLSKDSSHGERWASACTRLGIAPNISEPIRPLYSSYAFSAFSSRRVR